MYICHICGKIGCRFLPIGHFHCALVRHCKLLFANLSRSNLSICYKLPQILKLPQISRRSCIFARACYDISRCTCYLFVRPPATFAPRDFWSRQNSDKNWTQIGHPRYSVADTRSSYQKFRNSFKLRRSDAKNADLQDFIWRAVAKSVAVCAAAFW